MDEASDPAKILRVPEEFAKAKRNLLFWCVITLTVIAAHTFEPRDAQSFKLIVIDATIPYWFARLASWGVATFMLIGFIRSITRLTLMNSNLGRMHESEQPEKVFAHTIRILNSVLDEEKNYQGQIRRFEQEYAEWRKLSDNWSLEGEQGANARLEKLRKDIRKEIESSAPHPTAMIERAVSTMDAQIRSSIADILQRGSRVEDVTNVRSNILEEIHTSVSGLEKRLADLTAFSNSIATRDIAWLSWWDKRLPFTLYVFTSVAAVFASF